jgi:sugar transferase EpsL
MAPMTRILPISYRLPKRLLDITVSGAALLATAPLTVPAAVAVRVKLGSPVLFRQPRPGKDGVPFTMIKLRTMRDPAPGEEGIASDAARLTPLGKLLRSTSIDELPTLLNVLKGDMSLIGPRPLLMQYLERYTVEQARRHEVKPGVTGWAQVNGRNSLSWEDKFKLDVWYVDHCSLALDLKILAMTALKVVRRDGIAQHGQATMTEFMGTAGA